MESPSLDVEEINEDSLHLTAVAQVLTFALRALPRSNGMTPPQNLASGRLSTWISWSKHLQPLSRSMPHLYIGLTPFQASSLSDSITTQVMPELLVFGSYPGFKKKFHPRQRNCF